MSARVRPVSDATHRLDTGLLTHKLIARCAADPNRPDEVSAAWILPHATEVLADHGGTSRRRAMLQKISTLGLRYFRQFGPDADWVFAGAEMPLDRGRTDLAWATPTGRLIDELKTSPFAVVADDGEAVDQVVGYARSASRDPCIPFAGVRLLTLSVPANALFITPSLAVIPLEAGSQNGGAQ